MTNSLKTSDSEQEVLDDDSDFIDFYRVLGVSPDATIRQLRQHITELYADAQTNRDHRNLSKRLHYEALCELLPYARLVLLQPEKRARYDQYWKQYRNDRSQLPDFETIVKELVGRIAETPQELTDLLAIVEEPTGTSPSSSVNQSSPPQDEPKFSPAESTVATNIEADTDTNPIIDNTPESPVEEPVDAQLKDAFDMAPVAPEVLDAAPEHEKSVNSEKILTPPIVSPVHPEPSVVSTEQEFSGGPRLLPPMRWLNTTRFYIVVILLFVVGLLIFVPR